MAATIKAALKASAARQAKREAERAAKPRRNKYPANAAATAPCPSGTSSSQQVTFGGIVREHDGGLPGTDVNYRGMRRDETRGPYVAPTKPTQR